MWLDGIRVIHPDHCRPSGRVNGLCYHEDATRAQVRAMATAHSMPVAPVLRVSPTWLTFEADVKCPLNLADKVCNHFSFCIDSFPILAQQAQR